MLSEEFKTELIDGIGFDVCPACAETVVAKGAMKRIATRMGRVNKPLTPAQIEQRRQAAIAGAKKRGKKPPSKEKLARMAARQQLRGSAKGAVALAFMHDGSPIAGSQHEPWAYHPAAQKSMEAAKKKKATHIKKAQCIECYRVHAVDTILDPSEFMDFAEIEKSLLGRVRTPGAFKGPSKPLSAAQLKQRKDAARSQRRSNAMSAARADSAKRLKIKAGKMGIEARKKPATTNVSKPKDAAATYMERTIGVPQGPPRRKKRSAADLYMSNTVTPQKRY